MATKDFLLPDLGEGLTEGEIVSWLVAEGDVVEVDQYVAEIETAKAVVEVPSPFAGTIARLHGEPGEEVQVGAPLITIDIGGDDAPAPDVQTTGPVEDDVPVTDAGEEEGSGSVLVGYGTSSGGGSRRRRATANGADAAPAPAQQGGAPQRIERDGTPPAKPPVRKLAKDLGVDLEYVQGSGAGGVITRDDVRAFAEAHGDGQQTAGSQQQVAAGGAPSQVAAGGAPSQVAAGGDYGTTGERADQPAPAAPTPEPVTIPAAGEGRPRQERVKLNQMRKTISSQMGRSRREIPEAVTWVEADATPLWEYRAQLNAAQDEVKVSALAIIMRMVVSGLRRFPTLNASLDTTSDEMVLHRHVNLGFAAQTDRGLVVPVIEDAHELNTIEMAKALNDLAATARAGKLSPAQMSGGTFTVSNYGAFGVDGGDMVINHPEAAILGTGRIVDKPWVVDGEIVVRKVITYSIAFDHRIIDGGEGAGFIRHLADLTENPTLLTASL